MNHHVEATMHELISTHFFWDACTHTQCTPTFCCLDKHETTDIAAILYFKVLHAHPLSRMLIILASQPSGLQD